MRCVGRFLVLVACLVAGTAQAQTADLSQDQIEQIRRGIASQLSQNPENRALRFRYAQASYQSGRNDAAKYHLQQLMRTSPNARDLQQLQEAYATVVEDSPWSFGLNFSILPSTNINKTSSNEIFETPLGPLLIVGGGTEESGVGLRYGARVNYEAPLSSGASLTYGLELNRSQYPDDRLNNLDGTVELIWSNYSLSGRTTITPYATRYVYDVTDGDSSDSTRYGLRVGYEHFLTSDSSITGTVTAERRDYDEKDYLDGSFLSTSLSYQNQISETYHLRLQTSVSASAPEQDHLRYIGVFMSGELSRPIQNWGTAGVSLGLGMREYEGDFPLLGEPRDDRSASIGISFRSSQIRVLGSSPKVSCQVQQNWSNVALYEYRSTDCGLTFERSF
jgi:opacity protein-like surface antigen